MNDLFSSAAKKSADYSAKDIEVLEGLEPVRRRPGMYIGGTDERALHHLVAEVLDNAMDEAVAGHASRIELELDADGFVTVRDNGRGIPVDPHPKFTDKSALEVILTTLHSGGKFGGKAYQTSGGLHGVGVSVVNALSDELEVEVARDKQLFLQSYARGKPRLQAEAAGANANRRGTTVTLPSPTPRSSARTPASSRRGSTAWRAPRPICSAASRSAGAATPRCSAKSDEMPAEAMLHFPGGLADFLAASLGRAPDRHVHALRRRGQAAGRSAASVEWAIAWPADGDGFARSYCNTVPTPEGGTHEAGLRSALSRARSSAYAELTGNRKAAADHRRRRAAAARPCLLSLFMREPQFQGQTKERLAIVEATRLVETTIKRPFRPLADRPTRRRANVLLDHRRRAGRGAAAPQAGQGAGAQDRDPQAAPARQARRLHPQQRATAPRSSSSRATPPAARPSRRATARPRRSCRCAARS